MLDLDGIRDRIRFMFEKRQLKITGNWDEGHPISRSTVRHFLEGRSQSTTLDTISKLAIILDTSEDWILFGDRSVGLTEDQVDEQTLSEMIGLAIEELQPGMSYAEIRQAVSSNLHEQLRLRLADVSGAGAEPATDLDIGARSRAPTTQGAEAK